MKTIFIVINTTFYWWLLGLGSFRYNSTRKYGDHSWLAPILLSCRYDWTTTHILVWVSQAMTSKCMGVIRDEYRSGKDTFFFYNSKLVS